MLADQCNKAISFLTSDGRGYRNGNNIQKFVDAIKVRNVIYVYCYPSNPTPCNVDITVLGNFTMPQILDSN